MDDQTTITTKDELKPTDQGPTPPPATPKQVTQTETKISSTSVGPEKPNESLIHGISGRFWITLILAIGLIILPMSYLLVITCGFSVDASVFMGIFTAYIGVASVAVGTYLGQAPKPKGQTQ